MVLLRKAFYPVLALSLALMPHFAVAASDDATIEEVVVTGSYLKRTAADSPSPLSVVDRADLEQLAPTDVKDIISSLTYNSGSMGIASTAYDGGDNSTGNASINLRNLGNGSTLVLVNGKRAVLSNYDNAGNGYPDVQGFMPNIALERVEVVKDGASALYGSDAIAGVVNFITRDDFEGFELVTSFQTDDQTKLQDDVLIEGILGVQNDRGGIVVAMSHLERDPLYTADRFEDFGRSGLSTNGQPGRFRPADPTQVVDLLGNPAEYGGNADLDCNAAVRPDFRGSQGTLGPNLCVYDFSSFFTIVSEEEYKKVSINGHYRLSDTIEVYGDAFFTDAEYVRNNSLFPATIPPTIPSHNPGVINDAARRGIQPVDLVANWRLVGGHLDAPFSERPVDTRTTDDKQFMRMTGGVLADLTLGGKPWTADLSVTQSSRKFSGNTRSDAMTVPTNLALSGLGGNECDVINGVPGSGNLGTGNCFYLNPFASAYLQPDGSPQTDPMLTNSPELLQSLIGDLTAQIDNEMTAIDFVLAGEVFDTPSGPVGLAIGAQWRKEEITFDNDRVRNNNGVLFAYGEPDWEGELTTAGLFVEVNIPIGDTLELNLAGRYEDFDEYDTDTVDPKVTLLWRPTDSLSVRASTGTSFRVASLLQAFGSETTLLNTADPLDPSGASLFIPSLTQGNVNLDPEEATVFNIGFSWAPVDGALEGLAIDVDYYDYEYEDIISRQSSAVLVASDLGLRCPGGLNTDPLAGPLCGFQPGGAFVSIGGGNPQVIRDPGTGALLRTVALYENSQSLDTSGIDLEVRYDWDWDDLGLFRAQLNGSWTIDYDLIDAAGNEIDGVGSRNQNNSVGHPLPEFRLRGSVAWTKDRHSASVTVNYIDEFEDDTAGGGLYNFLALYIGAHPTVDSMTTVDLQYSIQLPAMGFQSEGSSVTLGIKNAFDEEPPKSTRNGLFDPFTHDPRGRMFYASYKLSL